MIVAVIAMRMVQPSLHEVIDMIAMRHLLVPAARTMRVSLVLQVGRTPHGVRRVDRDDMFVNMVAMLMVQMAVMQIINMAIMANRRMPAVRAMRVVMMGMLLFGMGGHDVASLFV
jgi:hypothetical protein